MRTRQLTGVRRSILAWYAVEQRDFPWRRTRDPYAVLVSEVMLQQTQASRVAERFPRFIARFPSADALACAPQAEVLAEWSGLGYNRRALALQRAATLVAAGGWPPDAEGLELLPGIGPYTARAVASLAFSAPVGVVDTNVRRWLVRRLRVADRPADLQAAADLLAGLGDGHGTEIAAWTHATIEFGARICTSRAPRCGECPVARGCPSRLSPKPVSVARQPAFAGSSRQHRGALLRALAGAPDHHLDERDARDLTSRGAVEATTFRRTVDGLERDGLLHRSGGKLHLGGRR